MKKFFSLKYFPDSYLEIASYKENLNNLKIIQNLSESKNLLEVKHDETKFTINDEITKDKNIKFFIHLTNQFMNHPDEGIKKLGKNNIKSTHRMTQLDNINLVLNKINDHPPYYPQLRLSLKHLAQLKTLEKYSFIESKLNTQTNLQ